MNLNVGVQQGTTSESWINANKDASTTVTSFQKVDEELTALRAGSIDAVIIDYGPAQAFAGASNSGLKVLGQIVTGELYGLAVPRGDPDGILPTINAVLAQIKANGTYDQLLRKWFP